MSCGPGCDCLPCQQRAQSHEHSCASCGGAQEPASERTVRVSPGRRVVSVVGGGRPGQPPHLRQEVVYYEDGSFEMRFPHLQDSPTDFAPWPLGAVRLPEGVQWTPGMSWEGRMVPFPAPSPGPGGGLPRASGSVTPYSCLRGQQITPADLPAASLIPTHRSTPSPVSSLYQGWRYGIQLSLDPLLVYCQEGAARNEEEGEGDEVAQGPGKQPETTLSPFPAGAKAPSRPGPAHLGSELEPFPEPVLTDVTDALDIVSSPVVVGDWLVFGVHYKKEDCKRPGGVALPYRNAILGLYLPEALSDPRLYVLNDEGADTEGTLLYDPQSCVVYWPHVGRPLEKDEKTGDQPWASVTVLDARTFRRLARHSGRDEGGETMTAGVDSSGVLTPEGYVFGTTNRPGSAGTCNTPKLGEEGSAACGAVLIGSYDLGSSSFEINKLGQVDYSSHGFRTWVGGSVTADSDGRLFVGTTSQYAAEVIREESVTPLGMEIPAYYKAYHSDIYELHGLTDLGGTPLSLYEYRYGCSAVKIDNGIRSDKSVLTPFNPGVSGCRVNLPEDGGDDFKSAVAGEVVVTDGDLVWAQYTVNNFDMATMTGTYQVYALDKSTMRATCRFVMGPGSDRHKGATFYQAPTLASESVGFAVYQMSQESDGRLTEPAHAQLFRMDAGECSMVAYDQLVGERVQHSPVLVSGAHGDYVVLASDRAVYFYRQDGRRTDPVLKLGLGHGNGHISSPLVHPVQGIPTLFLLSEKGNLSILPTPIEGIRLSAYGQDASIDRLSFEGYGDAVWPRFRADNYGSGRPGGPAGRV